MTQIVQYALAVGCLVAAVWILGYSMYKMCTEGNSVHEYNKELMELFDKYMDSLHERRRNGKNSDKNDGKNSDKNGGVRWKRMKRKIGT